MAMNYKEAPDGAPQGELRKYAKGIQLVNNFVDSLQGQGLLPERFLKSAEVRATQLKTEVVFPPLSTETQRLVEQMTHGGYAVYETTGKTPADLLGEGMKFWYLNPHLENVSAAPVLLAFKTKPFEFFLPGSQNIPHDDQLKLIPAEQAKVDKKYPSAGLIVREGKLPEWTEVASKHFKATRVRIFGRDYGYNYTWTDTYESEKQGASRAGVGVGGWDGAGGLYVDFGRPDSVDPDLGLASLVEIPRK